jgi:hypothetical protein
MVLRVGVGKVGVCVYVPLVTFGRNELKCFEIVTCLLSTLSQKISIS